MTDPQPPRGPGRPPLDATDRTSVGVSFRLPSRQYDALVQRAARDRTSVADAVRRAVRSRRDDD